MYKKEKDAFWVVVPAYNEEKYLTRVLEKIKKVSSQIVVVDDGSSDATTDLVRDMGICVLRHRVNIGKGAALRTACDFCFEHLNATAVVMLDGDDQHDPAELPVFFKRLKDGDAVVFGVREEPNMPWLKLKVNRLSSFITYLFFGEYILDIPSGYKAFTKKAYSQLRWQANDYAVELEIAARTAKSKLPFSYIYIKSIYHDINKGMTTFDVLHMVKYLFKLRLTL